MIDIPGFILAIREGNMEQAANILSKYTNLPLFVDAFVRKRNNVNKFVN